MVFQIYAHPPDSPLLQTALKSALPYSINLVYRTQHPNRTQYANILSTLPPSLISVSDSIPKCWAAAYFDRSMRPETELWIFAAGEVSGHSSSNTVCADCRQAIVLLLKYMVNLPTPPMRADNQPALDLAYQHEKEHPAPGSDSAYEPSPGTYMRHLLLPRVVLLGAVHEHVAQICRDMGLVRREFPGSEAALSKFIFKISDLPKTRELPEGLRWGEMREQDIEVVRSRTNIPRSTQTLLSLKNIGVFEETSDKAVAWAFLGLDGSLTTLHTEEDYRGRGIAKTVAARIIRQHTPGLAVDHQGVAWSHADVYEGNVQSESVCKSLGGRALWTDYWIRIDLDRI